MDVSAVILQMFCLSVTDHLINDCTTSTHFCFSDTIVFHHTDFGYLGKERKNLNPTSVFSFHQPMHGIFVEKIFQTY